MKPKAVVDYIRENQNNNKTTICLSETVTMLYFGGQQNRKTNNIQDDMAYLLLTITFTVTHNARTTNKTNGDTQHTY